MSNFTALQTEWYGLINTAWPEIILPGPGVQSNLFTSVQAARSNILERIRAGNPALPWAVMQFGDFEFLDDFGVASDVEQWPITIYYIAITTFTQSAVYAKLSTLKNNIMAADAASTLTSFQVLQRPSISTSETSPVNAALLANLNVDIISGSLSFLPGVLVNG